MRNVKKIFFYVSLVAVTAPLQIHAAPPTLDNLNKVGQGAGFKQADIKQTVISVVQALLGFIGIIFFILILWGGAQWMLSGGNEKKIEDAKKRITSAAIGLALVLMSYAIARFVSESLATAVGGDGSGGSNFTTGS